jgi:hypothetical protein
MTRIQFRRLDGILLLDKSTGMSSNAALQVARRLFRAEKGGHTGSLDPLATGLLPLCFGEATKIAGLLLVRPRPTTPRSCSARPPIPTMPKARCCCSARCRRSVPKPCRLRWRR